MMGNTMNQGKHEVRDKASSLEIQDGQILIGTYGTLMRGRSNHERFCSGYLDVQRVEIPGVLRWLSPTIPMLHVPKGLILAMGTEDPSLDVATQARWAARFASEGQPYQDGPDERPHPALGAVAGEVFVFDDPEVRIPAIDRLEGFRPGRSSLYRRVLVAAAQASGRVVPAWVYVAASSSLALNRSDRKESRSLKWYNGMVNGLHGRILLGPVCRLIERKMRMQNKPAPALLENAIQEVKNLRLIGEGGFKAVYEATLADKKEALKVILIPTEGENPEGYAEICARIKREVDSLGLCECPYLVKLGSLAPRPCVIQGSQYLIYTEELLDGPSLRQYIREGRRPDLMECKRLMVCLLEAIRELKARDLIHRDIKPDNVVALSDVRRPFVILDLGVALKLHSTAITKDPDVRQGTLPYMAPEVFHERFRELLDYRSDIYSAGVTVYEYASGQHPISRTREDYITTISRILQSRRDPLGGLRPDLPASFCEIIDQLIRRQPALRPSNIGDLLERIEAAK